MNSIFATEVLEGTVAEEKTRSGNERNKTCERIDGGKKEKPDHIESLTFFMLKIDFQSF